MIAEIFLQNAAKAIDEGYTYIVPEQQEEKVRPGAFVYVPFGKYDRITTGVVTSVGKGPEKGEKPRKLKEIISVREEKEPLTEKEIRLCMNIREKYICTFSAALKLIMPPETAEKKVKTVRLSIPEETAKELISGEELKDIKKITVIRTLLEDGETPKGELLKIAGAKSDSILKTLLKKNYISMGYKEEEKEKDYKIQNYPEKKLNPEQQAAFDSISEDIDSKSFHEVLLFGVTSGGKTEVYLKLVQKVLNSGGKAVVLVPEISLTPQMTERFTGRFGNRVAIIHSRLSDGERRREWLKMKNGQADIVIGPRSAVFAPFDKVDLFIIDEEQEKSYKSEETPRYHGAEVAVMRAKEDGATVVYGSATPSVKTFYRAEAGEIQLVRITKRATTFGLPKVTVEDMREERDKGYGLIFSERTIAEMGKNIRSGEQTVVFVQRRGFSRDLICTDCGKTMICGKCGIAMAVHEKAGRLICHYCGNTVRIPEKCPSCGGTHFTGLGFGTERAEEELLKLFPGSSVVRMDSDTTSRKNGHEEAIRRFKEEKCDFLVGTQMIAKGHDFPGVTLVVVLSADSLLGMREYDSGERAFQLITQVCGRAGRGEIPGRVIIQAYNLDSYALNAAVSQDYGKFYDSEIAIRSALNYPPFCHMGGVIFTGEKDRDVYEKANESFDLICECARKRGIIKYDILGPSRCQTPKIGGRYRWRIIIKTRTGEDLTCILRDFAGKYDGKGNKDIKMYPEV